MPTQPEPNETTLTFSPKERERLKVIGRMVKRDQHLFLKYAEAAHIEGKSIHSLRHSIAAHLLLAGRGIEYVAGHLGHRNIQDTRAYAQITDPLREQVMHDLKHHPKIVRVE